MAKLVYAPDLGSGGETRGGSSPLIRTSISFLSKELFIMNGLVQTEVPIQVGAKFELPGLKIIDISQVPGKEELLVITKDTLGVTSVIGFANELEKINSKLGEHFIKTIFVGDDPTPIFIYHSED